MIWAFWAAVALIAYTYAGYPLWLWTRSRLRPAPVAAAPIEPSLSIVMVVRNEERTIKAKLENLMSLDYPETQMEVVVVSDGSTDGTEAILHEYAQSPRVKAVFNQ